MHASREPAAANASPSDAFGTPQTPSAFFRSAEPARLRTVLSGMLAALIAQAEYGSRLNNGRMGRASLDEAFQQSARRAIVGQILPDLGKNRRGPSEPATSGAEFAKQGFRSGPRGGSIWLGDERRSLRAAPHRDQLNND